MLYTNPILEQFLSKVEENPNKKIIIETSGKTTSATELADKSLRLAVNLSRAGFKKGDKVLLLVRPCVELVVFILAVMRLSGVIVIVDPGMGKDVFENRVKLAKPKWIFGESIIFTIQNHPIIKFILRKKGYDIPEISKLKGINNIRLGLPLPGSLSSLSYDSLLNQKLDISNIRFNKIKGEEDAMIVFTSGTTSFPKGVVHTISSLTSTIKKIAYVCKPSSDDIFEASEGHFLLLAVSLGVTTILSKKKFDPEYYFEILKKYRPTTLFGPPAEFIDLLNYCKRTNSKFPHYINKIFLGSAPVLSGFLNKLIPYLSNNTQITCIYGMTEILPVAMADGRKKANWQGKGDFLGNFIPGVKYKITKDKELLLNGDHQFKNYLGFDKTEYLATGDLVNVTNNELVLVGRKKDMIIKGNFNIYPELYESTIQKIPGVSACAMVGVRNEQKEDEEIVLVIEPEDFSNKVLEKFIENKLKSGDYSIDTQALPDKILIMKLPRSGRQSKIDKNKLRKIILQKYL